MMDVLETLLASEIPQPRTKEFKHKRLSAYCKSSVTITIKELGFSRVAEIKRLHDDDGEMCIYIILVGVTSPNLKDERLLAHYGAITPAELVKKMFLPGEIEEISREIERLSGYRTQTLEELKKK